MEGGFSQAYRTKGVTGFYESMRSNYNNPHRYDIERLLRKKLSNRNNILSFNDRILDLACGSGEVTVPLLSFGYKNIRGTDPYTAEAYIAKTSCECDQFSFVDILQGSYEGQHFDCIICSYAMHLVKQSLLHDFCNHLARLSKKLIIVSPHKFPVMKQTYGWNLVEATVQDKIHFRLFQKATQSDKYYEELEGLKGLSSQKGEQTRQSILNDECNPIIPGSLEYS